jgi:hypothetical protein
MEDAVLQELHGMATTLDGFLAEVDPALLHAPDAAKLLEAAVNVEQRAGALKTLLAKRAADAGQWSAQGHRSPEEWLAKKTGTSYGQAAGTLHASEKLEQLPALQQAARDGELSGPQLNELASAATPDNENKLLEATKHQSFKQLRRTCANEKASQRSAERDEARHARIHRERTYTSFADADGAYCFGGKATAAAGARIDAAIAAETDRIFKAARAEGRNEPLAAYRFDALVNLVCGGGAKVDTTVVIRVDESRLRGEGGMCEATSTGPVPVSEAIGAILAGAFVKVVLHDGVDISKVSHPGRHIPEVLRTAVHERDGYTCVRPGCGATTKLQIHHWVVEVHKHGVTALWNLASVCPHDHYLLTHAGHRLEGGPGNWSWTPPPP